MENLSVLTIWPSTANKDVSHEARNFQKINDKWFVLMNFGKSSQFLASEFGKNCILATPTWHGNKWGE